MKPLLHTLLAGLALTFMSSAMAQTPVPELSLTGQPTRWLIHNEPYRATGFGRAVWGLSPEAARALIAAEYPAALASLKEAVDPVDRTLGMAFVVPALPPAGGAATISYVFGATSRTLVAVHVAWRLEGQPTDEERAQLLKAGSALVADLSGWQWPLLATTRGLVTGPGALTLFTGRDASGSAVEVRLTGMAFDVERRGAPDRRPAPAGPASLHYSIVAKIDSPDVYRIPSGAF
ncbi:hypothetical protein CDN99_01340 [Roseateles aquatilis]|uniref:Uncharacterized protein n=1 Tax=Roseateles aquatilis TaxID=431061 RepID=A0A246JKN8_9BURK|nr:hypothetical protein [Roseateles aquatilis]OWQ93172.1 hypothetical protein CDN99_01340 [Roseateles aquatilis]